MGPGATSCHTQQAWEAPTRALGHPSEHGMLFPLQTQGLSWSLAALPRCWWGTGGQLGPGHSTAQGRGPARRKPNHQAVESGAAEPAVLDKWRGNSWQCSWWHENYLRTRQKSKLSICKLSQCWLGSHSKKVYPQELSPHWGCWVNWRWPLTDPQAASASGVRQWQPGSTSPKQRLSKYHCERQQLRWARSQPLSPVQHGGLPAISLHPPGISSIFIRFFLWPFPLAFQTWNTGSYYSFSCFLPAMQLRAATFHQ